MSTITAIGGVTAVQARIEQIQQALASRRQQAVVGAGASTVAAAPTNALGASAVGEVGAAATGTIDSASSLATALGIDDPSVLEQLGGTSSLTGLEGLTSTTALGSIAGTGTGTFDDVFTAAVQRLRAGWTSAIGPATSSTVGTDVTSGTDSAARAVTVGGVSVGGGVDPATPYATLFEQAGAAHGIPPRVLAAIGWVESRFRTDAISSAGAVGMMQFLPGTAASMGVDPYDPASAIDGTARYLRSALDRFGSLEQAIAAYNVGPGTIARSGGVQPGSQAERYLTKVLDATGTI